MLMLLPFNLDFNVVNFSIYFRSLFVDKESNRVEFLKFSFGELVLQRVQIRTGEIDLVKEFCFSVKLVGFSDLSLDIITLIHQIWI